MQARNIYELPEYFTKEKAQPDAFPFAMLTDHVHAIVPVSGADERQAALAEGESSQDRAHAVLIQTGGFFRPVWQIVVRVIPRIYLPAFKELNGFIQHAGVAGAQHVTARRQGQPKEVVGTMRSHAPP